MRSCRSPAYNRTGCGVRVGSPFRVQRCGSGLVRFRRVQVGIRHYGTGSGAMRPAVFGRWERGNRGRRGSGADATGCGRGGPKCVWVASGNGGAAESWSKMRLGLGRIGRFRRHRGYSDAIWDRAPQRRPSAARLRRVLDRFSVSGAAGGPVWVPHRGPMPANPARTRGAAPRAACASEHGEPLTGGAAKQWWPLRAAGRPSGGAARRSASSPLWWSGRGRRGRR